MRRAVRESWWAACGSHPYLFFNFHHFSKCYVFPYLLSYPTALRKLHNWAGRIHCIYENMWCFWSKEKGSLNVWAPLLWQGWIKYSLTTEMLANLNFWEPMWYCFSIFQTSRIQIVFSFVLYCFTENPSKHLRIIVSLELLSNYPALIFIKK